MCRVDSDSRQVRPRLLLIKMMSMPPDIPRATDARKLSDWLNDQPGLLKQALSRAEQLSRATSALRALLNEPWSDAVRFAAIEGEIALIYANHAAAATLLRFRVPAVLAFVQEHCNPACAEIQIKVQPETYTPK